MSTKIERRRESLLSRIEFQKSVVEGLREKIKWMLSPAGVRSYKIGSRSKENYNLDLTELYELLETAEDKLAAYEDELEEIDSGKARSKRRAVGIIPCDRC